MINPSSSQDFSSAVEENKIPIKEDHCEIWTREEFFRQEKREDDDESLSYKLMCLNPKLLKIEENIPV